MKYNAFIEADEKLYFELGFLARAVSDDKTRFSMQFIYVEQVASIVENGAYLLGIATDGHHMHIVDHLDYPGIVPGYWKVIRKKKRV
jgi:hypothetical protein